jgi:hypothetical protein
MTDNDNDDATFRALVRETSGKIDRLYELVRPYFEQSPAAAEPSPPQQSPLASDDDEPTREELMERLVQKNRELQLAKIYTDYLEGKLEKYEPKDDDEVDQDYE